MCSLIIIHPSYPPFVLTIPPHPPFPPSLLTLPSHPHSSPSLLTSDVPALQSCWIQLLRLRAPIQRGNWQGHASRDLCRRCLLSETQVSSHYMPMLRVLSCPFSLASHSLSYYHSHFFIQSLTPSLPPHLLSHLIFLSLSLTHTHTHTRISASQTHG